MDKPDKFPSSVRSMAPNLWAHRGLIFHLTRLFVQRRYKGSALGVAWAVVTPLCMLLVYTLAFSVILGVKWQQPGAQGHVGFAMVLFCGMVAFDLFSQSILAAPELISNNPAFVKKVIFPVEVLPVVAVCAFLFETLVKLAVLVAWVALSRGLAPSVLWLPLAFLPLVLFTLGLTWVFAVLGAFARDLSHALGIVVQMLFFLTPILYPLSAIPGALRWLLALNPLASIVGFFRDSLLWGSAPCWWAWVLVTALSLLVCTAGYHVFMKNKQDLADVV